MQQSILQIFNDEPPNLGSSKKL